MPAGVAQLVAHSTCNRVGRAFALLVGSRHTRLDLRFYGCKDRLRRHQDRVWAHSGLISHDPVDHGPASRVLSTSLRPSNRAVAGQHWRPSYTIRVLQLRSGDRLLLVTDGMVDQNAIRVDLSAEPTPT